jgi:hypothetical protein
MRFLGGGSALSSGPCSFLGASALQSYRFVGDFDQTLTFNDSGYALSETGEKTIILRPTVASRRMMLTSASSGSGS